MAWLWRDKKGKRIEARTESILKRAEADLKKAKDANALYNTLLSLQTHLTEVANTSLELMKSSMELTRAKMELERVAYEAKQIVNSGDTSRNTILRLKYLGNAARTLKDEETKLRQILAVFERDELKLDALEAQEKRIMEMIEKTTKKMEELTKQLMRSSLDRAYEIDSILEQAFGIK